MDRLSIFEQTNNIEANSGMVFGGGIGDIKKQLDPSFQSVDDVVLPPGFEHMKVYLRIRPFTKSETHLFENQNCMQVKDETTVVAFAPKDSNNYRTSLHGLTRSVHKFTFSKIFPESTSQAQLFSGTTFPVVKDFIDGHNCLMFTYGVTNSGKTFTVLGTEANPGLVPRALDVMFNSVKHRLCRDASVKPRYYCDATQLSARELIEEMKIKQAVMKATADEELELAPGETTNGESTMSEDSLSSTMAADSKQEADGGPAEQCPQPQVVDVSAQGNVKFSLWVSFLEIYNESAYDLLEHVSKKTAARIPLPLKEDRNGMPYVKGLKEIHVTSAEEAIKLLKIGQRNLQVACTRLNHNSSRSHCIFTVRMLRLASDNPHVVRMSMLSFCDLAGSERQSKTHSIGMRMKEASNINASLLQLGLCIKTLRHNQRNKERQQVVPYRDSKLTRLFQSFFSGHGTVTMVINVSGCATTFDETLHALKYGALATQIVVGQEVEPVRPPPAKHAPAESATAKDIRRTMQWATPRTMSQLKAEGDKAMEVPLPEVDGNSEEEEEEADEDEEDVHVKVRRLVEENARLVEKDAKHSEEYQKLWQMINTLKAMCAEEMKKNIELEQRVRYEVTTDMQKQLIELENSYKDRLAYEQALQEERHEHRLDIVVASIKRTKKRKRVFGDDESEDGGARGDSEVEVVSIARQLAEERSLRQSVEERCAELLERVGHLEREVDALQAERNSLAASKTALGDQLTRAEFQLAADRETAQTKIRELEAYIKQLNDAIFVKENALQRSRASVETLETDAKALTATLAAAEKKVEDTERELRNVREKLSVVNEAQQRLDSLNQSLTSRLEEGGAMTEGLKAEMETLKSSAESDAALVSAKQKEFEAEVVRLTKQREQDLADAAAEKRQLQDALEAAEAAVRERDSTVERHAGELERLTSELERLTSAVEQEQASSTGLRAELDQQRLQLTVRNAEAAAETEGKQSELESQIKSLQAQVTSQAEQLQQVTSSADRTSQEKQTLAAALDISAKTVIEQEAEIAKLRELVQEAEERFSRYITPSERREEEEAEAQVRQISEQLKQREDALQQASVRAENAEKEKQSLEAALEIAEKTSEERECEIEELRDQLRQADDRLASETARLQKLVDEEKASAEDMRVKWQQLQSMTQNKESVSSVTTDESLSLSAMVVDSAKGGSKRPPRRQAAAAAAAALTDNPDFVGPSPSAPPSRPRRNRRPKNFCTQVDMSMDDDFESDSKLSSTKENIDVKSVATLESDSNAESEEPHLVSPPHSPLPKSRPRRQLLKAVQDEQFCASPMVTSDDVVKDRASSSSSHNTVLQSLRNRNRKH